MAVWKLTVRQDTIFKHKPVKDSRDIKDDNEKVVVSAGTTYLVVSNTDDFPEHYHVTLPDGFSIKNKNTWYIFKDHAKLEPSRWPSYS